MSNDFLGQILGSVLGNPADSEQQSPANTGGLGGLGGALGGVLGNVLGSNSDQQGGAFGGASSLGGKDSLVAMVLPLAMQWVQRNGGIGALLERFKQHGYSQQAASWVSTGENEPVDAQAVSEVVGTEELSRLSRQLGVPDAQVASGLAQILPQVVNQLTPAGDVPQDVDDRLSAGLAAVQKFLNPQGAGA